MIIADGKSVPINFSSPQGMHSFRGVIRADTQQQVQAACQRIQAIVSGEGPVHAELEIVVASLIRIEDRREA
jgi:hypothetical protein